MKCLSIDGRAIFMTPTLQPSGFSVMHRFYLPPDQCQGTNLRLTGREAHHALHVLRVRKGEPVAVLDGAGSELLCEIQDLDRDQVHLVVRKRNSTPPPFCKVTLLQAVPKGKIIESIIQKATELGVCRVVPLLSERASTRLDRESSAQKTPSSSTSFNVSGAARRSRSARANRRSSGPGVAASGGAVRSFPRRSL